ncbi:MULTISPECIES: IMS domain-containing protein [unclassified Anabaena]|uniref:IMS domain-containing protein n=1 Tax=unclassified Anabaena TaxID=2619674 RepID=UPI0008305F15|nr:MULTISPECIES: IMS domain-containing protein [unclassified Anabaena]
MRIPLDYYRILGLPLAASYEQLRQAYSDRIVQLPRREYSDAAIASRKQLIEEAYVVLSDPKERRSYDQLYLAHAYDPDSTATTQVAVENRPDGNNGSHGHFEAQNLSIDIASEKLVGALLILQELGEYELVLKLGRNYLGNQNGVATTKIANPFVSEGYLDNTERSDILLTVALACLELGREQWQQGHYENAAMSLAAGLDMLSREGMFTSVQAEIQADLYKLRPYRILELLALPQEQTGDRHQGLELLQSILDDRGGIDGNGNDQSGLNIDDFLRFIQQLRKYLTVAEQHKLFEGESKRPSAVATYLAVYASIARGFTHRQPALIRHAKQMLTRLAKRQDVHLEQSLCALLLGQTEEATRVLELSQEYETLALIREKSQDSPDLLPGLCVYTEQWLQTEVFPHFRDLAGQKASLKDYFANPQVQAYLEALPNDAETTQEWKVINRQSFPQPLHQNHPSGRNRQVYHNRTDDQELPTTPNYNSVESPHFPPTRENTAPIPPYTGTSQPETPEVKLSGMERAARATHHVNHTSQAPVARPTTKRKRRKPGDGVKQVRTRSHPRRTVNRKARLAATVFISLAGILVFWVLVSTTVGVIKNWFFPAPVLQGEQLSIQLNEPPIDIPDRNSTLQPPEGVLTEVTARDVIQTWLSTKAAALGPNHDLGGLDEILAGSALSQWRLIAQQVRAQNHYRLYDHSLKVEYINKSETDPNRAVVGAMVRETTRFYENGRLRRNTDESLRVRYELIRREGVWLIQGMSAVVN